MSLSRPLVGLCLAALFSSTASATDTAGARPGAWTYDVPAARALSDNLQRPLIVMFGNSRSTCYWCERFAREIEPSPDWTDFLSEQLPALAFVNYAGPNWDKAYYLSITGTNSSSVAGFPLFALYAPGGTNLLEAFTYNPTGTTYSAAAFVARVSGALTDYLLDGEDIWDPTDNSAIGATVLDFKTLNQRQFHTLNRTPDDTDDWFKLLCVTGRRHLLRTPQKDYQIAFDATNTLSYLSAVTNVFPDGHTSVLSSFTSSNTVAWASTNHLGSVTNFSPAFIEWITNSLPSRHLVESVTNSVTHITATTNVYSLTSGTNYPSRTTAVTNGTPPEIISPTFRILNPARTAALPFELVGVGVTQEAPLTALTNGCLFTPPPALADSYCFPHVSQAVGTNLPSFSVVEIIAPRTNLTETASTTNRVAATVTVTTLTNVWLTLSYSGPTNLYTGLPPPNDWLVGVIVSSNLLTETFRMTVTNGTQNTYTVTRTNSVVTTGSNAVTYAYSSTQYRLNYRLWEPGEVGFAATAVRVSEGAAQARLAVTRTGAATGELRLRYTFEDADTPGRDYEARNGHDFKAAAGDLFWADGQSGTTNITVDLIADLRPTWEGDERFAVVLAPHPDAPILQTPVNAASNAVVTLLETAKPTPGTLRLAGWSASEADPAEPFANPALPAVTVTEGDSLTLWVERAGGSNGVARVRLTAINGSAQAPADFAPLDATLEWADGEAGPKPVTLNTVARDAFNRDAVLTVRMGRTLNAAAAGAAAVTVTLRDTATHLSLADTAPAASRHGAAFSVSSGYWYWSATNTLRCEPLVALGQKAVLRLTVTGPGVLTFGYEASDGTLTWTGGPANTLLLKDGKQTVTWTFTQTSPTAPNVEAYAALHTLRWFPLLKACAPEPANAARTSATRLSWTLPSHPAVTLGGDFANADSATLDADLTSTLVAVSPAALPMPDAQPPALFGALWPALPQPQPGKTYKWRVDTVYSNHVGTLVRAGDVWSFTALAAGGQTDLPPDGQRPGSGAYEAVLGVRCDFGAITEDAALTYALASGRLPPGLSLDKATGRLSGIPTRTGSWTLQLQATETQGRVRTPYASAALTVLVRPLAPFAGTYTGWLTDAAAAPAFSGAATLTLGATGKLSARVSALGTSFAFAAPAFEAAEEPDTPGPLTLTTLAGTSLTDSSKARFTHTLENLSLAADGTLTATARLYRLVPDGAGTRAEETLHDLTLFRNDWGTPALQPLLASLKGYYTVSLPFDAARNEATAPWGSGYATLTVADNGAAKLGGLLADGTAWSCATTLLPPETNGTPAVTLLVFAQPSAYSAAGGGLCGLLRLTPADAPAAATADAPLPGLHWWHAAPTCVAGATNATVSADSGFLNTLAAAGGHYDTLMNLQTYYLCRDLTFEDRVDAPAANLLDRLPADHGGSQASTGYRLLTDDGLLPFGVALAAGAATLTAEPSAITSNGTDSASASLPDTLDLDSSTNAAGLTFSLVRATGLFTGAFTLVYEREGNLGTYTRRTSRVSFSGIHTPLRPDALDPDTPATGVQGAGFYLIPDSGAYLDNTGRIKPYTFNWSFAFELLAEENHDDSWCDGLHTE